MIKYSAPDLTQHPPRSGRVQLGGYVHLPRLLDKARATIAKKNGDYHYACPLDMNFFEFTGIAPKAFLAEVKKGRGDTQMLAWVRRRAKKPPVAVATWSAWLSQHGPGGSGGHAWISETLTNVGKDRDDVRSFFDLLDLDDYVSFGGNS